MVNIFLFIFSLGGINFNYCDKNTKLDISLPTDGQLCLVNKTILSHPGSPIVEYYAEDSLCLEVPYRFLRDEIYFPLENEYFLREYFGTADKNKVLDSIQKINREVKTFCATIDYANVQPDQFCLGRSPIEQLDLKLSPVYNGIFTVEVNIPKGLNDNGLPSKVLFTFTTEEDGDIVGFKSIIVD